MQNSPLPAAQLRLLLYIYIYIYIYIYKVCCVQGACSGAVEARSPHNLETRVRSQTRCVFQFVKVSGHLLRAEAGSSHQSLGLRNRMFVGPSSSEQAKPTQGTPSRPVPDRLPG